MIREGNTYIDPLAIVRAEDRSDASGSILIVWLRGSDPSNNNGGLKLTGEVAEAVRSELDFKGTPASTVPAMVAEGAAFGRFIAERSVEMTDEELGRVIRHVVVKSAELSEVYLGEAPDLSEAAEAGARLLLDDRPDLLALIGLDTVPLASGDADSDEGHTQGSTPVEPSGDQNTDTSLANASGPESASGEQADGASNEDTTGESTTDGESEDGESEDGESEDGESEDGESEDGESEDGESEDGESEDGESEDGESEDGESEDGETSDDLTAIKGLGPKTRDALVAAGVTTFAALAQTAPQDIRGILDDAGVMNGSDDAVARWQTEASALAA